MHTAHKIEIAPNNKQRGYFSRASGTARFSYNWALKEWKTEYESGSKPNEAKLRKKLNSVKKSEFPWMAEVTKIDGKKLWVPKLGWVKLKESFRFKGHILSATISRQADRWYVSVAINADQVFNKKLKVWDPFPVQRSSNASTGVDLGITTFATLANG